MRGVTFITEPPKKFKISQQQIDESEEAIDIRLREYKIREVLDEYFTSDEYLCFEENYILSKSHPGYPVPRAPKLALKYFKEALSYYQMSYIVSDRGFLDSVADCVPVEDENQLYFTIGVLLDEIRKFPLSFYKALKI